MEVGPSAASIFGGTIKKKRIIIFSVHYGYPTFMYDQEKRLSACQMDDLDLLYCVVTPRKAKKEVLAAAASPVDGLHKKHWHVERCVRHHGFEHGDCLAIVVGEMFANNEISETDFLLILDHDAHPLSRSFLIDMVGYFNTNPDTGGIGCPQWHRKHTYLHPSCALIRAKCVQGAGIESTFMADWSISPAIDTFEGYTLYCEENGIPLKFFMVESTDTPWATWDSVNAPGGSAILKGEYGEDVHVGNNMAYGLVRGWPLVSHLWAATAYGAPLDQMIERYTMDRFDD